jgi:hypothetical protein
MANNIVHGRATIKVNGRVLMSNAGATFDPGGYNKTTVKTDQGIAGFTRETRPAKIVCKVPLRSGDSLSDFEFDDATITFRADSGQEWLVSPAWTVGEPVLANDGYDLNIEGPEAKAI